MEITRYEYLLVHVASWLVQLVNIMRMHSSRSQRYLVLDRRHCSLVLPTFSRHADACAMTVERVLVGGGGDGQGGDSGEGSFIIAAIVILSVGFCFLGLWCLRLRNAPFKGENKGKKIIARIRKKRFEPAKRIVRVRPVHEIKARYNPNVGHWGFKTAPVQHSAQVTSLKTATTDRRCICSSAAAARRHGHAGPCCCRARIECSAAVYRLYN